MTFPRTLADYTPPSRDVGAWTDARVEESPGVVTPTGPWVVAPGAVTLTPALPDPDPLEPLSHRVSFDGLLRHGFARVTWLDATGGEGPTPPIPLDDASAGWLCSLEEVKSYLHTSGNISTQARVDEGLLRSMIDAASDRMRSSRPDRTLSPNPIEPDDAPVTLTFPLQRTVQVPDLRELVSLSVDGVDTTLEGVRLRRRPGELGAVWLSLRGLAGGCPHGFELAVTGYWGPPTVFPRVREAAIVWVARVFHQRTARFADNAPSPDGGVLGYFRNLPPDVKVVLDELWIPGV